MIHIINRISFSLIFYFNVLRNQLILYIKVYFTTISKELIVQNLPQSGCEVDIPTVIGVV